MVNEVATSPNDRFITNGISYKYWQPNNKPTIWGWLENHPFMVMLRMVHY